MGKICRGYYRCSSSKGCPARKQVERSRVDPTMLVVTYSCEHNHPWPASRNHHNTTNPPTTAAATPTPTSAPATPPSPKPAIFSSQAEPDPDEKFTDLGEESLITTEDFTWFSDFESPSSTMLESPIFAENNVRDADVAMFFPMREEDESLFADLGELPECSLVFRRGVLEMEEERRRCTVPMCGTTSWDRLTRVAAPHLSLSNAGLILILGSAYRAPPDTAKKKKRFLFPIFSFIFVYFFHLLPWFQCSFSGKKQIKSDSGFQILSWSGCN